MLNPIYARRKMKARTGGEKGRRLVQEKTAEGKTTYELSWKVKVMLKNGIHACCMLSYLVLNKIPGISHVRRI